MDGTERALGDQIVQGCHLVAQVLQGLRLQRHQRACLVEVGNSHTQCVAGRTRVLLQQQAHLDQILGCLKKRQPSLQVSQLRHCAVQSPLVRLGLQSRVRYDVPQALLQTLNLPVQIRCRSPRLDCSSCTIASISCC